MPAITPDSTVLVTGASGFIAVWVAKVLLERGFRVRGTVRSAAKGEYLARLFEDHAGRFEYVIVEDIAKDGAFDEAVEGVDAVEHVASPFHMKADDPDELIIPAVKGTSGVLESIRKYGPAVQRVVVTSSVAALIQPVESQQTLTDKDWNEFSLQEVSTKGKAAAQLHKYRASKTLAERAAWAFVESHTGEIEWDLTTFNPPLVWGPTIHEIPTASAINTSVADIYALIKGAKPPSAAPGGNWVDVRDLATAHADALTTPHAGGARFVIASGPFAFQDVLDAIHAASAGHPELAALPRGSPGAGKGAVHPVLLDTTPVRAVLGVRLRDLGETARDTAKSLLEREKALGW